VTIPFESQKRLSDEELQYCTGIFESFDVVTRKSLLHALQEHGLSVDNVAVDDVLESYKTLNA
jgi:hypothetical protein